MKAKRKGVVIEFERVPRVQECCRAAGGGLRVRAVRAQAADGCSREDWVFLVLGYAVSVERVIDLERRHVRAPWSERERVDRAPLSERDRAELRALAGAAIARVVRVADWDEAAAGLVQ